LRALTGTSGSDVWAAGLEGTLLHFDGSSWSATQKSGAPWSPVAGPNQRPIYALFEPKPNALFAGGSGVYTFDGAKWSEPHHHGSHLPTTAIWGADPTNVWAVGLQGTVNRFDGHDWVHVGSEMGPNLFGVWGSAANDVWIVGSSGAISHWDGAARTQVVSGTDSDLYAVRGFTASDVWTVGDHGTLLHWQGSAWTRAASPTPRGLLAIWGASTNDVWVVGESGVVLHRQI